jgi:hypothetical protein
VLLAAMGKAVPPLKNASRGGCVAVARTAQQKPGRGVCGWAAGGVDVEGIKAARLALACSDEGDWGGRDHGAEP